MIQTMVIQRLSDKKFLSLTGYMNDVTAAEFFDDEEEALGVARRTTEWGTPAQIVYVTITMSNVKG